MNTYYQSKLIPFVDDLIYINAKKTNNGYFIDVSMLTESDLENFSSYLLQCDLNNGEEWEWSMHESAKSIIPLLIKYLKTCNQDIKYQLLSEIALSLIEYYRPTMNQILEERASCIQTIEHYEANIFSNHHYDNGEAYYTAR